MEQLIFKMKRIAVITGNESKLREFRAILEPLGFTVVGKKLDLVEPKTLDQAEVAISTAEQAFKIIKGPLITDDTGIYFAHYNNFPGPFTKFLFQAVGFEGIKLLMDVKNKKAYFQTALCFTDGQIVKTFQGRLEGIITLQESAKFNKDWSYDSIFIPQGSDRYFSEYSLEERKTISHRARALEELVKFLKEHR